MKHGGGEEQSERDLRPCPAPALAQAHQQKHRRREDQSQEMGRAQQRAERGFPGEVGGRAARDVRLEEDRVGRKYQPCALDQMPYATSGAIAASRARCESVTAGSEHQAGAAIMSCSHAHAAEQQSERDQPSAIPGVDRRSGELIGAFGQERQGKRGLKRMLEPRQTQRRERRRDDGQHQRRPHHVRRGEMLAQGAVSDNDRGQSEERGEEQRRFLAHSEDAHPCRQQERPQRRRQHDANRSALMPQPLGEVLGHRRVDVVSSSG